MKRLIFYISSTVAVFACVILALCTAETVSVSENAKAGAEYGSCEVHTYDTDYIVITVPTCSATGVKWRACSVCGYRDIVETPKDSSNHTQIRDEWIYFPAPTCSSGGTMYKVCYACNGHVDTTDVPADASAHAASGETVVVTEATCAEKGVIAAVCKYCGELFDHTSTATNPDNHVTSDDSEWNIVLYPTCSVAGKYVCYCDNCGEIAITNEFSPTGFHYHDETLYTDKEANCTENGVVSYHCTECGMSMEEQEIPSDPDAHVYTDDFVVDVPATCTSSGEKSKHCIYCDKRSEITVIPADSSGHKYSDDWIVTKEATCSAMGLKHTVCTLCGEESIPVATAKTDHSYGDYEILQESADGLSAKVKYTCTVCGYEKEDILTYDKNNNGGDVSDGNVTTKIFVLSPVADTVITVDYDNLYISNVARNMTVAKFNSNFTNINSCVVYDTRAAMISENSLIATGYRVNYEDVSGIVTNYYVCVNGDLDSDGKVTAADARLVLRAAASLEKLSGVYFLAADVNSDGKISASDARKTLRVAANIEYFESTYKN